MIINLTPLLTYVMHIIFTISLSHHRILSLAGVTRDHIGMSRCIDAVKALTGKNCKYPPIFSTA